MLGRAWTPSELGAAGMLGRAWTPAYTYRARLALGFGRRSFCDPPRPRSPLAQAAWDYQEEVKARLVEDGNINTETAFEILANHKIRNAIDDGYFDDLEGYGKERAGRTEPDAAMRVRLPFSSCPAIATPAANIARASRRCRLFT